MKNNASAIIVYDNVSSDELTLMSHEGNCDVIIILFRFQFTFLFPILHFQSICHHEQTIFPVTVLGQFLAARLDQ